MSRMFVRGLQTLIPYWGDSSPYVIILRTLRLTAVLVVVLVPAFGIIHSVSPDVPYDPLAVRVIQTALGLAVLVASYTEGPVQRRPRLALGVLVYMTLVWAGYLAYANDLDAGFALGYLFVALAGSMALSLAWDEPGPLVRMLTLTAVIGVGVTAVSDLTLSSMPPLVFAVVSVFGPIVVFFAFYGRLRTAQDLLRSERQLVEAERMAQTGAWTIDLDDERRAWTCGMFDILGLHPETEPGPLLEFIHPLDRAMCLAEYEGMFVGEGVSDLRFRILRSDGTVRWVHGKSELCRDEEGQPSELRGVFQDITEHVEREIELERARDEAEAATRAQAGFLANMSHEIRTPLTAIIGFAQMLREEVDDTTLVEPIEAGGQRLLATLNSVLDLARMEAEQAGLELGPVDLAAEAAEVASLLRPHAESKGLAVVADVSDAPLVVLADKAAIGRVLTNLLSNAIKFTDAGTVTVQARPAGDQALLVVADTGRGMDDAFLGDLFEPFRQASTGWARSHEGTGLGMTITRRLVDAMGGSIEVESEPGVGTQFMVRIPTLAMASGDGATGAPTAPEEAPVPAAWPSDTGTPLQHMPERRGRDGGI